MITDKLTAPFANNRKAASFSCQFVRAFTTPAFGALSKTEVDNLVFALLIEAGALDPKSQIYEIARDLNVTPAKARNLLFQWQLRSVRDADALTDDLVEAVRSVRFAKDGDLLVFGIESPLLREEFRSRLKRTGVYADTSFSSELVRLPLQHFVEFLDSFVDEEKKQTIRRGLVRDGRLKDRSFRALALRVLSDLAKKLAGEAAGEITELFGDTVRGLITGKLDLVATAIDYNVDDAIHTPSDDDNE